MAREILARCSTLETPGRAGEEPQVVDHERDLVRPHRVDWLARVDRFEPRELLAMLLDRVGEAEQRGRALRRGGRTPRAERTAGSADGDSTSAAVDSGA